MFCVDGRAALEHAAAKVEMAGFAVFARRYAVRLNNLGVFA